MKLTIIRLQQFSLQDHSDLQKIWPQEDSYKLEQQLDEQHRLYAARFNDRLLAAVKLVITGNEGGLSQLMVREVTRRRGVGLYLLEEVRAQNPAVHRWFIASDGTADSTVVSAFMLAGGFTLRAGEWVK